MYAVPVMPTGSADFTRNTGHRLHKKRTRLLVGDHMDRLGFVVFRSHNVRDRSGLASVFTVRQLKCVWVIKPPPLVNRADPFQTMGETASIEYRSTLS
jgi:hypothetical protein